MDLSLAREYQAYNTEGFQASRQISQVFLPGNGEGVVFDRSGQSIGTVNWEDADHRALRIQVGYGAVSCLNAQGRADVNAKARRTAKANALKDGGALDWSAYCTGFRRNFPVCR